MVQSKVVLFRRSTVRSRHDSGCGHSPFYIRLTLLFILSLFNLFILRAQTSPPSVDEGTKPYGTYEGGGLDTISMANGSLTLHIRTPPGKCIF